LVLSREIDDLGEGLLARYRPVLRVDSFCDSQVALEQEAIAAVLPDFLGLVSKRFSRVSIPKLDAQTFHFHIAWNPRLIRLNPHARRKLDWLEDALRRQMS